MIALATAPKTNGAGNGADHASPPRATREEIIAALKFVPADSYQVWFEIGAALQHELGEGGREIFHQWSRTSRKYLADACDEKWTALADVSGFTAGTIFHYADQGAPGRRNKPGAPAILKWIDMRSWMSGRHRRASGRSPTARRAGKPDCSAARRCRKIDHRNDEERRARHRQGMARAMPTQGPAIYVGCEDETDELHRRFDAIAAHYGVTFRQLIDGGLKALCRHGEDAVLAAISPRTGKVVTTNFYDQLYEAAGDIKPINISIDTLSRVFAGNEIDRVQVYAFAMHMQKLALVANASVTILAHPSLAGMASGSGLSGSTAWHGAFRFRHYLKSPRVTEDQPDTAFRELEFKKTSTAQPAKPSRSAAARLVPSAAHERTGSGCRRRAGRSAFSRITRQVHGARSKRVAGKQFRTDDVRGGSPGQAQGAR